MVWMLVFDVAKSSLDFSASGFTDDSRICIEDFADFRIRWRFVIEKVERDLSGLVASPEAAEVNERCCPKNDGGSANCNANPYPCG